MPDAELHLKPRQLQAIGAFAAQWAFFETEMDFTIASLGHLVEQKHTLPSRFNERARRWRQLARARYGSQKNTIREIESIIDDAKTLQSGRGVILHGRLFSDRSPMSRKIYVETHRHLATWKITQGDTTAKVINEGALLVKRLAERLISFNQKHLPVSPPSLPRKYS